MNLEIIKKINEIDLVLRKTLHDAPDKNGSRDKSIGFLGGISGLSLFYYLNYLRSANDENIIYVEQTLEIGFSILNSSKPNPFHCNGISGFMNGLTLLKNDSILDLNDVINSISDPIDKYLTSSFKDALSKKNFDFLHGAEGILNYFLGRNNANDKIEMYLHALGKSKQLVPNKGIAWKSNVLINKKPTNVYNLGLAHGMTSTMILLSRIVANFENGFAKELLERNVEFYLSEEFSSEYYSSFPNLSSLDIDPKNSRLAWCYGDLSICIALWYAGVALKNSQIKEKAISICKKTLTRTEFITTGIKDAGLCHGTAGIATIYDRMGKLTGCNEFRVAAEYWITETVRFAAESSRNAGYKTWTSNGGRYETNVLSGIAGIGIALNSFLLKIDNKWDNCLLLS